MQLRSLFFVTALAAFGAPTTARAEGGFDATPTVGVSVGQFGGVEVEHLDLGIDVGWRRSFVSFETRLQLGRTGNGLGAHRLETGADLRIPTPPWLELGVGPHVAYGIVLRATHPDALIDALFGDIAAPGIGAHADLAVLVPLSPSASLFLGGRFTGDLCLGITAWSAGPELGVRLR